MDSIDLDLLKHITNRDNYYEIKGVINKGLCVKESWELVRDFDEYYKTHPEATEIDDDFKLWQRVERHPNWKPETAVQKGLIVDNVLARHPPNRASFLRSLEHLRATEHYKAIAEGLDSGTLSVEKAGETPYRPLVTARQSEVDTPRSLSDVAQNQRSGGFYWRLEDLNRSLGPLRKGDFILVGKRPEVGGTSFLCSELSYMLEQTEGNCVIFNNEESPDKVFTRMVSAGIGVDYQTLLGDVTKHQKAYDTWRGNSDFDLIHDTNMTVQSIHRTLEGKEYDLIGINVLLKVGGTSKTEDHDKLQSLGEECRRISQQYGPVVAIVQADPQATGMQYIPQDYIYKSKTALQGEADGLIMIGTDEDIKDNVRYIHVAKNKIPPAPCTDVKCKHIKSQVDFDMGTGRFTSTNFKTHSRST